MRSFSIRFVHLQTILLLVCLPVSAQAGLLSALGKLGKAGDKVDVPSQAHRFDLPEAYAGSDAVALLPGHNGQWNIRRADGQFITLSELIRNSDAPPALVIRASHVPSDLRRFDSIPDNYPVLIEGHNGQLFSLKRSRQQYQLAERAVRVRIRDGAGLKAALWHLQRPMPAGTVRYMHLDAAGSKQVPEPPYGSKTPVESIAPVALADSLRGFRNQTLVLSGQFRDGKLFDPAGRGSGIALTRLRTMAAEADVTLVLLDSAKAKKTLNKLARRKNEMIGDAQAHTTAGFLNRFSEPGGDPIDIAINGQGPERTAIRLRARQATDSRQPSGDATTDSNAGAVAVHALVKGATIFLPSEERSKELDRRWIPGVPSWITWYLLVSFLLGLMAFRTSVQFWTKIWRMPARAEVGSAFSFVGIWLANRSLFLLVYLPLFGAFSAGWLTLRTVWFLMRAILIAVLFVLRIITWPFRMLFRLVIGDMNDTVGPPHGAAGNTQGIQSGLSRLNDIEEKIHRQQEDAGEQKEHRTPN